MTARSSWLIAKPQAPPSCFAIRRVSSRSYDARSTSATWTCAAASENGVLVTRAGPGFVVSVAEWVIGVMIDLSRRISDAVEAYRVGRVLAPTMGKELQEATLGVIGYGSIGRYLCDLALGFGMRVVVTDPAATVTDPRIRQASLAEVLDESDFLVCLAPANPQTANLMNASTFAQMKRGAYFINASRAVCIPAKLTDESDDVDRVVSCGAWRSDFSAVGHHRCQFSVLESRCTTAGQPGSPVSAWMAVSGHWVAPV